MQVKAQPPKAPPWATITPAAPPSGTSISAVTACDLFLMTTTEFSRQPAHAPEEELRVAADQLRAAGEIGVEALEAPVVERQDVVPRRLDQEQPLELGELLGLLGGEVVGLGPVVGPVELPDVVVDRRAARSPPTAVLWRVTAVQPLW